MAEVIFLTSGSSWTVPANWNNANNKIECLGSGGKSDDNGSGGHGGSYARINNLPLTPGSSIPYSIGSSSATTLAEASTWFGNAAFASSYVAAVGSYGQSPSSYGSDFLTCIGTVKYRGGYGSYSGRGGGGAAGPSGAGRHSGDSNVGGNANINLGGAGGAENTAGGAGTEWDSTHGTGGGGGGVENGTCYGTGGRYGGGGGCSGDTDRAYHASGYQGIIVITYEPNKSAFFQLF